MTKEERTKLHRRRIRLINDCVKNNNNRPSEELLGWAMNQLFRAAREIDLLDLKNPHNLSGMGCDATALTILKHLIKTKSGYDLIKATNPKLLRGYRKPIQ